MKIQDNPTLICIVFDADVSHLNGTGAVFSLLLLVTYYFDRIRCLDQSLKPDAKESDIIRAKRLFGVTGLWAVAAFLGLGASLHVNYIICLLIYLCGWAILSLYGRPLLAKIEDPEKKRFFFYSLLPKDPRQK